MFYQNFSLIEGRLVQKPELKQTVNGKSYSFFSVCYNNPKKRNEPNEKGYMYDYEPHFFNCKAWNKAAEIASGLNKGENVSVVGKLLHDKYTAKDGTERENTYILVSSIKKMSDKKTEINFETYHEKENFTEGLKDDLADTIELEGDIPF